VVIIWIDCHPETRRTRLPPGCDSRCIYMVDLLVDFSHKTLQARNDTGRVGAYCGLPKYQRTTAVSRSSSADRVEAVALCGWRP
jgi:hypothetical protein